jgi:chemotaxis signal transduction protein
MVLVFTLGRDAYALLLTKVQEIIRYSPPRRVTSTQRWNRGRPQSSRHDYSRL